MTISSLFASHENLFAKWMMHHKFNDEIQEEPRFPQSNQDDVWESYYTISQTLPPVEELPIEELRKRRVDRINGITISEAPAMDGTGRPVSQRQSRRVQKSEPVYQIVHGPDIQKVEKKDSSELVKYGNFWGQTRFVTTDKQTGHFLVDGWLVVSVPEHPDVKEFEFNSDTEITVFHKFDEAEQDPVSNEIAKTVHHWFTWQNTKLSNLLMMSFGAAVMLSLSVIALGNQHHLAGKLLTRAFLASAIAMQSLALYAGIKLYQLQHLQEKMSLIRDIGHWVLQIRQFAPHYPVSSIGAPIDKFFTPREIFGLNYLRKNTDVSIRGYISRFFSRISCLPLRSTRV